MLPFSSTRSKYHVPWSSVYWKSPYSEDVDVIGDGKKRYKPGADTCHLPSNPTVVWPVVDGLISLLETLSIPYMIVAPVENASVAILYSIFSLFESVNFNFEQP